MRPPNSVATAAFDRRGFLSSVGRSVGLAALSSSTVAALLKNVTAATARVAHLTSEEAARDEDFWFEIQQAFSVIPSRPR